MAKTYSGKRVVRVLCRAFDFSVVSQKGSHVKLRRRMTKRTLVTIVPLHKELARGTLMSILELAQVDEQEFRNVA